MNIQKKKFLHFHLEKVRGICDSHNIDVSKIYWHPKSRTIYIRLPNDSSFPYIKISIEQMELLSDKQDIWQYNVNEPSEQRHVLKSATVMAPGKKVRLV